VTDIVPIAPKLAKFVRMLASDKDGDVVAAARAIVRVLETIGADIHDVADRIEHSGNGRLSEAEMREIYDAGIKEGVRRTEQARRTTYIAPQFPSAREMAMHCYQRINNLNEWEREFITNMVLRTRQQIPLYPKQQSKLEQIYVQQDGRI
jgi:hypothetical protein